MDKETEVTLSPEEQALIETGIRLQALRAAAKIADEFYSLACRRRESVQHEIKTLEEKREALTHGQLLFDVEF